MLYNEMLKESKYLEQHIHTLESKLQSFPKENFYYTKNGKYNKWFRTDGKNSNYIRKADKDLAEKLAYKKYLICLLDDMIYQKEGIDSHLKHHFSRSNSTDALLTDPVYKHLLPSSFSPKDSTSIEWINAPYERNKKYPEQLTIETTCGIYVRSKSEALIAMILSNYNIPFRYECELRLGEIILYPDFTILHPKTNKIYYFEHFGMMDEPKYCNKTIQKLQTYFSHGILPTMNLITTYETSDRPISAREIEEIVKKYFL